MFFKFFVFSIFLSKCSLFTVRWFIPFADWPVWWIGVEWSMTDALGVAPADWNRASNETFFPGVRGIWVAETFADVWLADTIFSPDIWLVTPGEPIDCWRWNLSVALWNIPRLSSIITVYKSYTHLKYQHFYALQWASSGSRCPCGSFGMSGRAGLERTFLERARKSVQIELLFVKIEPMMIFLNSHTFIVNSPGQSELWQKTRTSMNGESVRRKNRPEKRTKFHEVEQDSFSIDKAKTVYLYVHLFQALFLHLDFLFKLNICPNNKFRENYGSYICRK